MAFVSPTFFPCFLKQFNKGLLFFTLWVSRCYRLFLVVYNVLAFSTYVQCFSTVSVLSCFLKFQLNVWRFLRSCRISYCFRYCETDTAVGLCHFFFLGGGLLKIFGEVVPTVRYRWLLRETGRIEVIMGYDAFCSAAWKESKFPVRRKIRKERGRAIISVVSYVRCGIRRFSSSPFSLHEI